MFNQKFAIWEMTPIIKETIKNYTQLLKSMYYYVNYLNSALEAQGEKWKTC